MRLDKQIAGFVKKAKEAARRQEGEIWCKREAFACRMKRQLCHAGFRKVGGGARSTVWSRSNDKTVVKLADDAAYAMYIGMAKDADSKHFPRIHRSWRSQYGQVYIMERLDDWSDAVDIDDHWSFIETVRAAVEANKKVKDACVATAVKILAKVVSAGEGHGLDLHRGNVMYRGKVPVITDPVV